MTLKNLALGSTATLAFAGLLMVTTPGSAQGLYPKGSTPEEIRQTDALNSQASEEAVDANADVDANIAAQAEHARAEADYQRQLDTHQQEVAQHDAAQADYNAKTQAYQNQTQAYQNRLETYQADRQNYEVNQSIYGDILANLDDQRFALLPYPDQRLVVLSGVPAAALQRTLIRDRTGAVVGEIRNVAFPRVMVRLSNGQMVWVRSPRLRYDPARRMVLTDLAYADLLAMPRAVF